MSTQRSKTIIGPDMVIKGDIRNGGDIEVRGYVEGTLAAERLTVLPGGRVFGTVKTDTADVQGKLQGTVAVKALIQIGATGSVSGDVRYGQLALATGGDLDASVRNVPPELAGDLNLVVRRGRSAPITSADLTAVDPDDKPDQLTIRISAVQGGRVARAGALTVAVDSFTAADLAAGAMVFVHDGSAGATASFAVEVTDRAGASSGAPSTVTVGVL